MLSINTADLKQLSGSEKLSGLWETYVWHKRLSALQTGTLIRAYPAAGLLRALYKPQGYFPSRQKKVIHMQLQLLRNLRLVQATFRSSGRHSHLSLPGCRFTAGTLEIPRIFFEQSNDSNMQSGFPLPSQSGSGLAILKIQSWKSQAGIAEVRPRSS